MPDVDDEVTQPNIVARVWNSLVLGATHELCLRLGALMEDRTEGGGVVTVPSPAGEIASSSFWEEEQEDELEGDLGEQEGVSTGDIGLQKERDLRRSRFELSLNEDYC